MHGMEGGGWLWLLMGLGIVLLGATIGYAAAQSRRRPKDPTVEGMRDAKTREIYRKGG
jgi:hypothetical protein